MAKWLLLIFFASFAAAETYYATPSPTIPCPEPGVPCYTLSQYAVKPPGYFNDFTILILMSGNYNLDANFSIRGIQDLTIVAPSPRLTSVTCQGAGRFEFQDIQHILISDIELTGCTHSIVSVQEFTLEGSNLRGKVNESTELVGLELRNVRKGEIVKVRFTSFVNVHDQVATTGGAMITYNSSVTITGTMFEENQAHQGGAIFIAEYSTVLIEDCVFNGNQAVLLLHGLTCNGGAIYVSATEKISNTVVIKKSSFYNNLACNGGAITTDQYYSSNITIVDTLFDHNEANHWDGGGVYIFGHGKITNCLFSNNKARNGGGGIMIESGNTIQTNTITGSKFSSNEAQLGGAGYFDTVTIRGSEFKANTASHNYDTARGGAITHIRGSFVAIYNSTFDGNSAEYGGAMHMDVIDTYLVGCVFTNNYAQNGASAIAFNEASNAIVNMTDTEFSGNYGPVPTVIFSSLPNQYLDVNVYGYLIIRDNSGHGVWSTGYYNTNITGQTIVANNTGGFSVTEGSLAFNGTTEFKDNNFIPSNGTNMPQAAAVFCRNGKVTFQGSTKILYDPGVLGGPIASVGCTVSMTGDLTIQNSDTLPHSKDTEGKPDTRKVGYEDAVKPDCKTCRKVKEN